MGVVATVKWACVVCDHCIHNDWVEQWICIKFCIKIEHSSVETIQWFRRLQLWTTGDWQLHHDSTRAHPSHLMQKCWQNIKSPRWLSSLQPRFGTLKLLAFPKTKIISEGEEISDHWWDSGKYDGTAVDDLENCVRFQGAYFKGDWGVIFLCTSFLHSASSSINVSIFLSARLNTFWTELSL